MAGVSNERARRGSRSPSRGVFLPEFLGVFLSLAVPKDLTYCTLDEYRLRNEALVREDIPGADVTFTPMSVDGVAVRSSLFDEPIEDLCVRLGGNGNIAAVIEVAGCENEIRQLAIANAHARAVAHNGPILRAYGVREVHYVATNPDGVRMNEEQLALMDRPVRDSRRHDVRSNHPLLQASYGYYVDPEDPFKVLPQTLPGPRAVLALTEDLVGSGRDLAVSMILHDISLTRLDVVYHSGPETEDPLVRSMVHKQSTGYTAARPDATWLPMPYDRSVAPIPTREEIEVRTGSVWGDQDALYGVLKRRGARVFGGLVDSSTVMHRFTPAFRELDREDSIAASRDWTNQFGETVRDAVSLVLEHEPNILRQPMSRENLYRLLVVSLTSSPWEEDSVDIRPSDVHGYEMEHDLATGPAVNLRGAVIAYKALEPYARDGDERAVTVRSTITGLLERYGDCMDDLFAPSWKTPYQVAMKSFVEFGDLVTAAALDRGRDFVSALVGDPEVMRDVEETLARHDDAPRDPELAATVIVESVKSMYLEKPFFLVS